MVRKKEGSHPNASFLHLMKEREGGIKRERAGYARDSMQPLMDESKQIPHLWFKSTGGGQFSS